MVSYSASGSARIGLYFIDQRAFQKDVSLGAAAEEESRALGRSGNEGVDWTFRVWRSSKKLKRDWPAKLKRENMSAPGRTLARPPKWEGRLGFRRIL